MFTTGLNVPSPETNSKKELPKKEQKVEIVPKQEKIREWKMA